MAERQRGMGRGLAAILAASPRGEGEEYRRIPLDMIVRSPNQPRHSFDEEALQALADSLRSRGVLQPVLVKPAVEGKFELIAGERRWRAAAIAELEDLPAIVRLDGDANSLEMALIENMAREDLNPVEEARACAALVEELGLSREEVGLRVGRSRVAVSNLIRLLDLPDEALEMLEQGLLSEGHGRALLMAEDHNLRRTLARSAAVEGWSVRELESVARKAAESGSPDPGPPPPDRGRTPDVTPSREVAAGPHPDLVAGAEQVRELLEPVVGRSLEINAEPGGGYRVVLEIDSVEDAQRLAERLSAGGG